MKNKFVFIVIAFFSIIGSSFAQYCTSDSRYTEVQYFDSTEITIGTDIQYGIAQDHLGNPDTLRMDLYYPNLAIDLSPKRPFIMLFHGGGFTSGDKASGDIRDLCIHLALRGFVCASVNYRLGDAFTEYGQYKARYRAIQDGNAALRFIVNNANAVRIDTSWLFVGGQSAGSLLSLGMVYADQSELDSISLLYNATAASVELGNLNTSGNNLTNPYSIKGVFNNWGAVTDTEVDVNEMIPTIAFHGELDTTVLIDADNTFLHYTLNGSRTIHDDLLANGVCTELTVDTAGEHGIYRNASSVFRAQRASCFFKSVFCDNCANFYTTDSIPSTCSTSMNLEESIETSTFNVYPNPFESSFEIEGIDGPLEVKIFNCLGQLVYQNESHDVVTEIDLEPGIYVLHVNQVGTNQSFSTKLIKK